MVFRSRRVCAGFASVSLMLLMGQGCPGGGSSVTGTISELEVSSGIVGGVGRIRVTLLDPVSSNTQISLATSNSAIADVPSTLTIPQGSSSGTVDYSAITAGVATITASVGSSERSEQAYVVSSLQLDEISASGADVDTGGSAVQTGATGTISVYVNASVAEDTVVNLASDNPAVVTVPATITIPAFDDGQSISFLRQPQA